MDVLGYITAIFRPAPIGVVRERPAAEPGAGF